MVEKKKQNDMYLRIREIKNKIEELEYVQNGLHRLSGTSVEVRNLRIRGDKAVADVYLIYEDRTENHPDLEYDLDKLEVGEK